MRLDIFEAELNLSLNTRQRLTIHINSIVCTIVAIELSGSGNRVR